MAIGQRIVLPSGQAVARTPDPAPRPKSSSFVINPDDGPSLAPASSGLREYTIRSGDTLLGISTRELKSSDWARILEVNERLDPKKLRIGQVIRLPAAE